MYKNLILLSAVAFIFFQMACFGQDNSIVVLGDENSLKVPSAGLAIENSFESIPGGFEIIVSNTGMDESYFSKGANPFGHIAIRINDTVYTVNQHAIAGEDESLIQAMPLEDYLYGVKKPTKNAEAGSNFGLAYVRDSYGIRVVGIEESSLYDMVHEIQFINDLWRQGNFEFRPIGNNCSTITERVLLAGGIETKYKRGTNWLPTMPIETFRRSFEAVRRLTPEGNTSVIVYKRVIGARPQFSSVASRSPLTILSPWRGFIRQVISKNNTFNAAEFSSLETNSLGKLIFAKTRSHTERSCIGLLSSFLK